MKFEVLQLPNGKWTWELYGARGALICHSAESYAEPGSAKKAAHRLIRSIQGSIPDVVCAKRATDLLVENT